MKKMPVSEEEWEKKLTPEQFRILRKQNYLKDLTMR